MMTRQNQLDEEECTAKIKPNEPLIADESVNAISLNSKGSITFVPGDESEINEIARKTSNGRFYIKSTKYGKFFDPATNQNDVLKMTDNQKEIIYSLREVTASQFDSYVEYINGKCQNTFLLRNAERGN